MKLPAGLSSGNAPKGSFLKLLRMQWKFGLREPLGLAMGIIFPVLLLILFGFIGKIVGGNFSGLSLFDLYVPTIIVIGLISIALYSIPFTLVRDREIGWLRRVSTTPLSPQKLLLSLLIINLIYALISIIIILLGSIYIFGAPLNISVLYFSVSILLTLLVMFSLGFVVAAVAPTQRFAQALMGGLFYPLLFFAGLWVQPATVANPLRSIMYYSPAGAAVRALLYSLFNTPPPYLELVALIAYTIVFATLAIRYFRWQ